MPIQKRILAPETTWNTQSGNSDLWTHLNRLALVHAQASARIARVDHVTGLPTRTQFETDYAAALEEGNRSLILLTLADARHFNELLRALGHAYSEDFIRAGADRLSGLLPQGTTLYHVSVLSFAFFCRDEAESAVPSPVERIVKAFRSSILCDNIPIDSRAGVGVSSLLREAVPGELLRATLTAAQDSRKGFEGWARYDRKADEAHRRAFKILTDLPQALRSKHQLALHYQPRIAMQEGRCTGVEALIRWQHPELGTVPPGEFVSLAETTALITPLTRWVIHDALKTMSGWREKGYELGLSINVSPRNLEEPHFVEFLMAEMSRFDISPGMIELEFTEGALASNPHLMLDQLMRLKRQGLKIAIDDFGSGYSNMSTLGALPARILKIDQSFIRPLEQDRKKQLLVQSIISLAHTLDYSVVAEGIETRGAYRMLCDWDCDEGQGYLMSRPLPLAAFEQWFEARGRKQTFYD